MASLNLGHRGLVRPILTALLLGVVALGVGCNKNKPKTDSLVAENEELRSRETQLQAALSDAEGRIAALTEERDRLNAQLSSGGGGAQPGGSPFTIDGATVGTRGSDIVVEVAGDVLFASGSVTLKNDAKRTLDQIASAIQSKFPGNEIQVAGFTDSDPIKKSKWGSNERLSAERALAVEEYLATRGIAKDRMYVAGYGPAKSKGTKAASRRVEIVILGAS